MDWIPDGWDRDSRKSAIIRDGEITTMPVIEGYFLNKDIDGAIEFLQSIKRAMAETTK